MRSQSDAGSSCPGDGPTPGHTPLFFIKTDSIAKWILESTEFDLAIRGGPNDWLSQIEFLGESFYLQAYIHDPKSDRLAVRSRYSFGDL